MFTNMQYNVIMNMNSHYQRLSKVKSSIDTSAPKSLSTNTRKRYHQLTINRATNKIVLHLFPVSHNDTELIFFTMYYIPLQRFRESFPGLGFGRSQKQSYSFLVAAPNGASPVSPTAVVTSRAILFPF